MTPLMTLFFTISGLFLWGAIAIFLAFLLCLLLFESFRAAWHTVLAVRRAKEGGQKADKSPWWWIRESLRYWLHEHFSVYDRVHYNGEVVHYYPWKDPYPDQDEED